MQNAPVYKAYRLHTTRRTFGTYISMLVSVGKRKLLTEDALTATVLRVPGGCPSEEEAVQAATRDIDEAESRKSE